MAISGNVTGAVILAAGNAKRMKTDKPKALCEVLFKPMLDWVVENFINTGIKDICIVIGNGGDMIKEHVFSTPLYNQFNVSFVVQHQQLGTGHAVIQANDFIASKSGGDIIILCGDAPFIDSHTISDSYTYHTANNFDGTVITATLEDPTGYGRIIRKDDTVCGITEHKDTDEVTVKITEVNSGTFWFKADQLESALAKIKNDNSQNEYYLTDAIAILNKQNKKVGGYKASSSDIVLGANDRKTLMKLNTIANNKNIDKHLANGIEIIVRDGVIIGNDVTIDSGCVILPNTVIINGSTIGKNCRLGPNSYISASSISDNSKVICSYVCDYETQEQCCESSILGPFDCVVDYCEE